MQISTKIAAPILMTIFLAACATTAPPVSHDGLTLVPGTKMGLVYTKPGANISSYQEFGLAACEVSFRKNWMRDQNSNRIDLSNRVTQRDVDRIRDSLKAECDSHFREALEAAPAYLLVEKFDEGENVLIIQPSIINLDVSAPDTKSAGMTRSYTTSAGEMTLVLELVDATTGETLARITDRARGLDQSRMQWSNSVTNRADADRILRRWATQLRKGLDQARSL